MIRWDRVEDDRVYLGFTKEELGWIVSALEEHRPDEEITDRLDALAMAFIQRHEQKKDSR